MKGKSKAKTVEEYINELAEPRKSELSHLHAIVLDVAPELKPTMQFGMPGYGVYKYKYASGVSGEWYCFGFASQKNYISLYACAVTQDNKYIAEEYRDKFPKANIGRSCIRVKSLSAIDQKELRKLIKEVSRLHGFAK